MIKMRQRNQNKSRALLKIKRSQFRGLTLGELELRERKKGSGQKKEIIL